MKKMSFESRSRADCVKICPNRNANHLFAQNKLSVVVFAVLPKYCTVECIYSVVIPIRQNPFLYQQPRKTQPHNFDSILYKQLQFHSITMTTTMQSEVEKMQQQEIELLRSKLEFAKQQVVERDRQLQDYKLVVETLQSLLKDLT